VPRGDAVRQASSLAGLVLGLERGDGDLLRVATCDHIAEPARIPLYPGYTDAREAALAAGAFGVAVSGAGPTALARPAPRDELLWRLADHVATLRSAWLDAQAAARPHEATRRLHALARDCERAIREGRMTVAESQGIKRFYEGELNGYSYLE